VPASQNQECIVLNRPAANYSKLFEFGQTFARLIAGLENISSSASGDVIMFVGNTGAGKSSLVHLLAGHTDNFTAEDPSGTGNFQIVDGSEKHVSKTTIDSTTTYPEAITDAESAVVFFDTPGFRDTRSPTHEVIATYGLQTVAKTSRRIKFVLLVEHNSLTNNGPRDDFTNSLQSFFSLLRNPNKYKSTTQLVATKVENRYIINKKGHQLLVSDDSFIDGVVKFLRDVKSALANREKNNNNDNIQFLSEAQSFIGDLIDNRSRISLFRKPQEEGPVMNSATIRTSLAAIRQSLLDTDGYVDVEVNDFGYTLSDQAKLYIRELFDLMNNYVTDVCKSFTQSFEQFLVAKYKNYVAITDITTSLAGTKHYADVLIKSVNASQYPNKFADALWRFVDDVGADTCSNDTLREIKQLTDFLSNVENVTDTNLYLPGKWADALYDIERIVKSEQDYYVMLNNLFDKLNDHSALNDNFFDRTSLALMKYNQNSMLVDEQNYVVLMEHLALNQFAGLKMNEDRLNAINSIYLKAKYQQAKSGSSFSCRNNTLVIVGNFLRLQSLDKNKIASCKHATTVALLATNKIYIDTNMGVDVLGGRNLVIIAPEWQVMGKFVISVDGVSRGDAEKKAYNGVVGASGKPGQSAGKFIGIALRYFNSEQLTVTANGGNGQNGQDGGDGIAGKDGFDGDDSTRKSLDDSSNIYLVYNRLKKTSMVVADEGSSGGDAGMGGVGGAGGFKGTVEMHSLSTLSPDRSTHVTRNGSEGMQGANGTPGHGGLRGCNAIIKDVENLVLFIPVGSSSKHEFINCYRKNPDGQLVSNEAGQYRETPAAVPAPPPVCELYANMSPLFQQMNNIFSHKLFEEFQRVLNEKFHCNA
ncbi:hypothetical protein LSTR_LSTR016661, partial [Laodelphax striatellus]